MKFLRSPSLCLLLFAALMSSAALAAVDVPSPHGYVTDLTGEIRDSSVRWMEASCRQLEQTANVQLAVLVVPQLQGTTVEDFAQQVYDKWKIGDKKSERGLLLLVSTGERKLRLHVGYGLEGQFPDGKVGALLDEHVVPSFRANDLTGGVIGGVTAVMAELGVGQVSAPVPRKVHRGRRQMSSMTMLLILLFVVGLSAVSPFWRWVLLNALLHSAFSGPGRSGGFGGGSGFGGFGGGGSGGGGASRGW